MTDTDETTNTTNTTNKKSITERIDGDEGLKSKRKLLTIVSITLLALSFSGAKIDEANSFIFKIKFANQNGLAILLVLGIIFLIVRYYNYAKKYHSELYDLWSERLLNNHLFYSVNPYEDEVYGLVVESRSEQLAKAIDHDRNTNENSISYTYFY